MQKILVIGDIHGCYDELQALLDKAGLGDDDTIIAAGDLVDRGPETPQVVEFFWKTPNARAVMGNHERKHMRAARHEVQLSISQQISKSQFGDTYQDALAWMSGLPLYIELADAVIVHGYLEPGISLELQNPSIVCGTMGGERMLCAGYDHPWYELYDSQKPVIVGHENYTNSDQPFVYQDKVYGLDTHCVLGKTLTGILLPSFQFISVPSRGNLWMQVRRSYQGVTSQSSEPREPSAAAWSEKQNLQLHFLFQMLQEANRRLMEQVQELPGYPDLTPRQQSILYSKLVGQGVVPNLLQLARQGKLDIDLMVRIVRDPERLGLLIDIAMTF